MRTVAACAFGVCLLGLVMPAGAQALYFPPATGALWDTASPQRFGYRADRIDSLYDFLGATNSKAFLLLRDGKIVLERYYGTFTRDSVWQWASAGKTMTALAVGLAQQEGRLSIGRPTSDYLGLGWSALTPAQEGQITVRHQLTMTSGLDDGGNDDCTRPACLTYLRPPGTRWAYHNAPYSLLDSVLERATGQPLSLYLAQRLRARTGITGLFVRLGFNNVYFSTARSMARFGLLMLNRGAWGNTPILTDTGYYRQLISPSQGLNPSYGYLWWLNGQPAYMVPQSQIVFPGSLTPAAPADMHAAVGKDGQMLCIVPSRRLVWVRMGQTPPGPGGLVSIPYMNQVWTYVNRLTGPTQATEPAAARPTAWHDPATRTLHLPGLPASAAYALLDATGRCRLQGQAGPGPSAVSTAGLVPGVYVLRLAGRGGVRMVL